MNIFSLVVGVVMLMPNFNKKVTVEHLSELAVVIVLASSNSEFEWSADQRKSLAAISRQLRIDYSDLIQTEVESKREKMELLKEVNSSYAKATDSIRKSVTEKQLVRLRQFELQLRNDSLADTSFGVLKLREELKLTDDQVQALMKLKSGNDEKFRAEVLELRKRVEKYRNQLRQKVLGELTKEQREKFEKAIGPERIEAEQFGAWFLYLQEKKRHE